MEREYVCNGATRELASQSVVCFPTSEKVGLGVVLKWEWGVGSKMNYNCLIVISLRILGFQQLNQNKNVMGFPSCRIIFKMCICHVACDGRTTRAIDSCANRVLTK